jgi:sulfonate transport system permease protein
LSIHSPTAAPTRGDLAAQASPPAAIGTGAAADPARAKPSGSRRAGRGSRSGKAWLRLISPLALLALWQIVSTTGMISTTKLPAPSTIWSTAVRLITTNSPTYGTLQGAMAISLERVAIGLSIGAALGVGLAMVAGLSRLGETAVDPLMQMLRTLPLFGLIPVFIVWFGIGEMPKVLLIALGSAIPL